MRIGVKIHHNNMYHLDCEPIRPCTMSGILECQFSSHHELIKHMVAEPIYYFCAKCTQFIFTTVEEMTDTQLQVPETYPTCTHIVRSSYDNDNNYIILKSEKVMGVVFAQARKRQRTAYEQ